MSYLRDHNIAYPCIINFTEPMREKIKSIMKILTHLSDFQTIFHESLDIVILKSNLIIFSEDGTNLYFTCSRCKIHTSLADKHFTCYLCITEILFSIIPKNHSGIIHYYSTE